MTFLRLFKVLIKENLSLKRMFGFNPKENKVKTILIALAIVYALGAVFFSIGYMFFDLGNVLLTIDRLDVLLGFIYMYAVGMSGLLILLRANGYLFQYKDYSILGPLPIKPSLIMSVKMTIMLIVLYLPSFVVTLPILVVYFYYAGFNILALLIYLAAFVIIPLVPVSIVSFLSYLIARLTAKMQHKNIANIIIMVAVVVGYMIYSFTSVGDGSTNPLMSQVDTITSISAVFWPMAWFANAIHSQNGLDLVFLVTSHLIVFAAFVFIVGRLAVKTNQLGNVIVTGKNNPHYRVIEQGVFKTLVIKEFRKFISVPLYAMNSGIGIILMLLLAIVSLFYQNAVTEVLPMLGSEGFTAPIVIIIYIGFCVAMTYTAAISLSLEGKNLWVLKSLPIPSSNIMWAKIGFNILLAVPASLVAVILFGISLALSPWDTLLLLVWAVSFGLVISVFDGVLNLLFPKLQFGNEVEVIKQSIAALFAVFGGFFFVAANGIGYFFINGLFGSAAALALIIAFNLVSGGLLALYIQRNAARHIAKM